MKKQRNKNKFKSSIYAHSDCMLYHQDDGCCAWISFMKKDVKTAEGYENIQTKKEFINNYCVECEQYITKSKERLEILLRKKTKYILEKERMERLIEGVDHAIKYNETGKYDKK
jgi:hypothetical protein